jgi:hypothetical protein
MRDSELIDLNARLVSLTAMLNEVTTRIDDLN